MNPGDTIDPIFTGYAETNFIQCLDAEAQGHVDALVDKLGPEDLYFAANILKKAAMDDINSSMAQIETNNEEELIWVQTK